MLKHDVIVAALLCGAVMSLFFAGMYIGVTAFATPYELALKVRVANTSMYLMLCGATLVLAALPPALRIIRLGRAHAVLPNSNRRAGKPS